MAWPLPKMPALTSLDAKDDYGSDIDVHTPAASEYGSEFDAEEETLIGALLTRISTTAPIVKDVVCRSIEDDLLPAVLICDASASADVRLQKHFPVDTRSARVERSASVEVEYDGPSKKPWSVPGNSCRPKLEERHAIPPPPPPPAHSGQEQGQDTRSPLERFRTKPKKPLSVTDLVSPAWCELQYWYVLTKFGRKPPTRAMKQGSKVHRVLEEQVHRMVPVQVTSNEDRFGLKLWNTIQGLRTLRETGLTRELEIWGIVEGQVVNGIIDEVSYACPDPHFEESLEKSKLQQLGGTLPLGQMSIEQTFANAESNTNPWVGSLEPRRTVYIADVKTRGVKSVPAKASLRPTWMQLMLYRKMLESLSSNTVDAEIVFARYNLQPLESFTETFMLAIGELDDTRMDDENPFAVLQASEIQSHNNLLALWSLMISEFSQTIGTFSDVLRAEFRYSKTGELIGSDVFAYDAKTVDDYISSEMSWWKGEREAKGVEIEEAFKCRVCDFVEECTWRKTKIEEATEKHRLRAASRAKSAI